MPQPINPLGVSSAAHESKLKCSHVKSDDSYMFN